jgi:hypothetical protein
MVAPRVTGRANIWILSVGALLSAGLETGLSGRKGSLYPLVGCLAWASSNILCLGTALVAALDTAHCGSRISASFLDLGRDSRSILGDARARFAFALTGVGRGFGGSYCPCSFLDLANSFVLGRSSAFLAASLTSHIGDDLPVPSTRLTTQKEY